MRDHRNRCTSKSPDEIATEPAIRRLAIQSRTTTKMSGPAHRRAWLAVPLALGLLGCRDPAVSTREEARSSDGPTTSEAIDVAVHGCELIIEPQRRRCLMWKPGIVSLWVPSTEEYELRRDGIAIASRTVHEHDGTLLRVEIDEPKGTLELVRGGETSWSIELARPSAQYRTLIDTALIRANAGDLETAATLLDEGRAELDADESALTRCLAAQLAHDSPRLSAILDELRTSPAVGCRGQAHVIMVSTQMYVRPDLNG